MTDLEERETNEERHTKLVNLLARWLSEITVTERTKSPNFAWGFFSTYSTVLA